MDKDRRYIDFWNYDLETDIFFFRDKSQKYHSSIEIGDLVLDLGIDGSPIGVELLNASKNFGVSKLLLSGITSFKSLVTISETDIEVTITVSATFRNANVEKVSISRGINDMNLQAGQIAMAC